MKQMDLTGMQFDRLNVIKRDGYLSNGVGFLKAWECLCECGNVVRVRSHSLVSGGSKSCGCLTSEKTIERSVTHGLSKHPLYNIWAGIKQRCGLTKCVKENHLRFYKNCGMYKKWHNFEPFYKWAIDKWEPGLDIDRKDTLSGYYPNNCRFVTRKVNNQNSKRGKIWFIEGKRFESSIDAAKFFGCVQSHIYFMCHGRKYKSGKFIPPKPNCYAIRRYPCQKS